MQFVLCSEWPLECSCEDLCSSQIKSADFKILLRYLEGLQGGVRERTVERSQAVVDAYDSSRSDSEDDNGEHTFSIHPHVSHVIACSCMFLIHSSSVPTVNSEQ